MYNEVGKIIWGRFSGSDTPWFLKLVYIFRWNVIIVTNMLWYRESYEMGKGRIIQEYVQKAYDDKKSNWLELFKIFSLNDTTIIPVLDKNQKYIGNYELTDILHIFNNTPFLNETGTVLVVSKGIKDYSFSEIAQIVESNKATLLGAFISNIHDDIVEATIKLSDHDLNNTIQTFRRYDYSILTSFHVDEYLKTLKERSEYLQKYLNI